MLQRNRYITMTELIGGIHTHMADQFYWAVLQGLKIIWLMVLSGHNLIITECSIA